MITYLINALKDQLGNVTRLSSQMETYLIIKYDLL